MSPTELTERAEELLDAYASWHELQAVIEAKYEQQNAVISCAKQALKSLGISRPDWTVFEVIDACAKAYADFRCGRLDHLLDQDGV